MNAGKIRIGALIFYLLALGLAIAGQLIFMHNPPSGLRGGLVLYGMAAIAFIAASSSQQSRLVFKPWPFDWSRFKASLGSQRLLSLFFFISGVAGVCYTAFASGSLPHNQPQYDLLFAWGLSLVAVMLAFVDWPYLTEHARAFVRRLGRPNPEAVLITLIVLATFLLRVINLEHIPYVLSGDEAEMGLEAIKVINGQLTNPFSTGWLSHPTLYFFIQGLILRLGGISTATVRLSSAMCSAITVLWLYKLAKRWYSTRVAIIAAILFTGYHFAIHYGRIGLNNIWDPFFVLGVLWYAQRGLDEKRSWPWAVSGLLLGLCVYFYMGARFIPIILAIFLVTRWIQGVHLWHKHRWHIGILVFVALMASLPQLNYFRMHLSDMSARWTLLGIFPSGWLANEAVLTGKSQVTLLLDQFAKSILAFNLYSDRSLNYAPGIPLLQFIPAIFFVFGIISSLRRPMQQLNLLLVLWFLAIIIAGGMLLDNPPTSSRFVLLIPPVILLVALGIVRTLDLLVLLIKQPSWLATTAAIVLTLYVSYSSICFYFNTYTPAHIYGGSNTEVADSMGRYLHTLGPGYRCFFFGPPRMYHNFATIPFLAQNVPIIDAPVSPSADMSWIVGAGTPVFSFLPERLTELDQVKGLYPQGTLRVFNDARGKALFYAYEVSPQ